MSRFDFKPTTLKGVYTVAPKPIADSRGYFERYFCAEDFKEIGLKKPIAQMNHSKTLGKGSIRGLHYQIPPFGEVKIVRAIRGEIYDVAIDIRWQSPTFLHYFGTVLSEGNSEYLYIPEGFAHGFQTLSDEAEVLYLVTAPFNPQADRGLNPLDSKINIKWPEIVGNLSEKDRNAPMIDEKFLGVMY